MKLIMKQESLFFWMMHTCVIAGVFLEETSLPKRENKEMLLFQHHFPSAVFIIVIIIICINTWNKHYVAGIGCIIAPAFHIGKFHPQ